jgi:hypothetical protein
MTVPEFYSCRDCGMQSPVRYQGDVMTDALRADLKAVRWKLFIAQESIMAILCHQCFLKVHHKQPFGWQKAVK